MAVGTLQLGVRTEQGKMCLFAVIERPQAPAIGRVATLALLSQSAFMYVLVGMAVTAIHTDATKR
jgi:hypothetical protein